MDSDRPDIADFLKEIEEVDTAIRPNGLASFEGLGSWRSSGRFWLLSLSIHALLLAVAFAFGGSRPYGRGGNPEGLFFSASFTIGDGTSSERASGYSEIDTTISGESELAVTSNSPFRSTSSNMAKRPLLTLSPADPESVFNADATDSLTAELASLSNASTVRQKPPQRLMNATQSKSPRTLPPAAQEQEQVDEIPRYDFASVSPRAALNGNEPQEIGDDIHAATSTNGQKNQTKRRPGSGGGQNGNRDGGVVKGTADGVRTTFFGIGARAKRFVYVIDASESMHQHRAMQVARDELWESLQELTESAAFQILFFNLKQHPLCRRGERPKILAATASNLRLAKQFLNGIQPDSGTDRLAAIMQALTFDPDVIFLLTDADSPELTPKDLADIRRINRRKAIINVVEFGMLPEIGQDNFLKVLARQHGGSHRYHNLTSPVDQ